MTQQTAGAVAARVGRTVRRSMARVAGLALACVFAPAVASTSGVVISQVYGGNGNAFASDYVELFNAGALPVAITGWSVQYSSAAGTGLFSANGVTALSGTLQPGQRHLVQLATTTGPALPTADAVGTTNMSGTAGKVILANVSTGLACNGASTPCNTAQLAQIVDLVGFGATANFSETAPAPAPSATTALIRNAGGCTDTDNNGADFSVGTPAPRNSSAALEPCGGPPPVGAIVPVCPASVSVATGATFNAVLTASDSDSLVNGASFLSGNAAGMSLSGLVPATAAGGSASVSFALDGSTLAGSFPVVIGWSNSDGQSATCTVNVSVAAVGGFTPIPDLQGSGATSPLLGLRTTRGVVTQLNNNGYYLQDPVGDGNPLTSDGIFVFTSTAPTVSVGQLLQVTGTVTEFDTSGATANPTAEANPLTEITNVTATTVLGTGTVTPTVITLPLASASDWERYEGMLVTVNVPLTASQNFFQGRYGQVTLSANGRLIKPTNLYPAGSAQALALQALNARSSLMLDDGTSLQNPNPTPYIGADNTLRAGDTLAAGLTGVIDYGPATSDLGGIMAYRIHPTVAPLFTRSNPRTTLPPAQGGTVKVASFNVLNFFTTFTNGQTAAGATGQGCDLGGVVTAANCRGADSLAEFTRQRTKIVTAMAALDADVLGLMEIQNNGNVAAQNLVDALNAVVGAGTYAVVPTPPTTGTDAIRVAMIYKPARVTLSGASMSDADAIHNRPPFAQTFAGSTGKKFSVLVNHFKSKGSCPAAGDVDADAGDGQGCWNNRRVLQASALLGFIGQIQAAAGDSDVVVIGDLNAYGAEDPIQTLKSGGLVDQVARFNPAGYSYVFDGEAGYLDHGLTTASLSGRVTGTAHWHINADEPSIIDYNLEFKQPACATCGPDYFTPTMYRSSDHDPVVIGLNLGGVTAQTVTFAAPADRAINAGAFTVVATASSGLAVSFGSATPAVCTASATGTVTLVAAGTCTLTADQAGNATFAAAPSVARSFTVSAAPVAQTISFAPIAVTPGAVLVSASADSGLAVVFSSLTPAVCSIAGNSVAVLATGVCTIAADQPGNGVFAAALRVTQSFNATVGGGGADIPTLPEWGALLMAGLLLTLGLREQQRRSR